VISKLSKTFTHFKNIIIGSGRRKENNCETLWRNVIIYDEENRKHSDEFDGGGSGKTGIPLPLLMNVTYMCEVNHSRLFTPQHNATQLCAAIETKNLGKKHETKPHNTISHCQLINVFSHFRRVKVRNPKIRTTH